jgi:pimeloyl-ACP methyl ester carboxylesterase
VHLFGELIAAHLRTATHRPLDPAAERAYLDRFAGQDGQRRYLDQGAAAGHRVPGAGHFLPEDAPDATTAALREFLLNRVERVSGTPS